MPAGARPLQTVTSAAENGDQANPDIGKCLRALARLVAAAAVIAAAAVVAVAGDEDNYEKDDPSTAVVAKCVTHKICLQKIMI